MLFRRRLGRGQQPGVASNRNGGTTWPVVNCPLVLVITSL
jgi:hypothetical protein